MRVPATFYQMSGCSITAQSEETGGGGGGGGVNILIPYETRGPLVETSPFYIHTHFMMFPFSLGQKTSRLMKQACSTNVLFSPSLKRCFCILGSLNSVGFA